MLSGEIRRRYLEFFEKKGHVVVASDLLVPGSDPTLLFTSAGMNQFKEQFMGKNITYKRAASCQKCLRTGDLEKVGKTPRHHTFFEMLGNFSFGDYFKKEAIKWAWEFMTEEMGCAGDRLWISVYTDDKESYSIWLDEIKLPKEKIIKLGADTNFWPADAPTKGPDGPCGPCSEIFYDLGAEIGCGKPKCDPSCECDRFVEVWNLVFTEFERKPDGSLVSLPNKNIDTGMGLERMVSVMQNVTTNFETDLFKPIIESIKRELGEAGKDIPEADICLMADHIRAAAFAVADGVSPSNEKRGYVVRKLIRRASLKGSFKKGPFLFNAVPAVTRMFRDVYPELEEKREHVSAIVKEEERRFNDTLKEAGPILDEMLAKLPKTLKGEEVFKLVDTYGLPLEVVVERAAPRGVELDVAGFERLMKKRREESRRGSDISTEFIFQPDLFTDAPKPEFSDKLPLKTEIAFILKNGKGADKIAGGERAEVITSPQSGAFYTEAGGQVGDTGTITKEDNLMDILNTCDAEGRNVLEVFVKKGSFKKNDKVTLNLDADRKKRTAMNHTATHLLQAGLRRTLGEHVRQSGSLVNDKRLRFDFTHMKKLSDRELRKVEDLVNGWVGEGISVRKEMVALQEARKEGALSFFGDKYEDQVRMVSIGDVSKELCGGTHVSNTAEIELMKIINESSVASGIRRIEALTGGNAKTWLKKTLEDLLKEHQALSEDFTDSDDLKKQAPELSGILETAKGVVSGDIKINSKVMRDYEEKIKPAFLKVRIYAAHAKKKKQKAKDKNVFIKIKSRLDRVLSQETAAGGVRFISDILQDADMSVLRRALAYAEKRIDRGVILLGGSADSKAFLACAVTGGLVEKGLTASGIVNRIAGNIEGGGGGSDTFAQAGGKDPGGLERALKEAKRIIAEKMDIYRT